MPRGLPGREPMSVRWLARWGGLAYLLSAPTKSHARALLKARLGLNRVPVGASVVLVSEVDAEAVSEALDLDRE
jgi:hypothetical protein